MIYHGNRFGLSRVPCQRRVALKLHEERNIQRAVGTYDLMSPECDQARIMTASPLQLDPGLATSVLTDLQSGLGSKWKPPSKMKMADFGATNEAEMAALILWDDCL